MAQFEIVKELAESLANLVRLEAGRQKLALDVAVRPPDAAFFGSKQNAVAVHLFEVKVDHHLEGEEVEQEVEVDGETLTILYPPPLILDLRFAVAVTGKTPLDEAMLIALAAKAFYERPVLKGELKQGKAFDERDIPIDADSAFDLDEQAKLLRALGVPHRPLLGYRVTAHVLPDREIRRTRKVERRTIELYDRHRDPAGPPKKAAAPGKR